MTRYKQIPNKFKSLKFGAWNLSFVWFLFLVICILVELYTYLTKLPRCATFGSQCFYVFNILALASSKLQAIGGFYLLSSILETFVKIWVIWFRLNYTSTSFLPPGPCFGTCLQIIDIKKTYFFEISLFKFVIRNF